MGFSIAATKVYNSDLTPDLNPGYAAPEQYQGADWLGTYTDVYGICAVLYKILSGIAPPSGIQRKDIDKLIPLWQVNPDVPKHVSDVIMQGLSVDYKERIQTITELVTKLFEQPDLVEHQKGSTQLLAKQQNQSYNTQQTVSADEEEDEEGGGTSLTKTIVTAVILAVIVGIGLYLLASMFTPDTNGGSAVSNVTQTTEQSDSEVTENQDKTEAETTEAQSTTEDYGTGAIMPDLVGLYYESVADSIQSDFAVNTIEVASDDYDEGMIVSQSIPADAEYNPTGGLTLDLEISIGNGTAELPSYDGVASGDYLTELSNSGISYYYEYEANDSVSYGYISRVTLNGEEIKAGDKVNVFEKEQVTVYISTGSSQ